MKTKTFPRLSFGEQSIALFASLASAVLLPQVFHFIGAVSGLGTNVGAAFLPMHIPIIIVGFIAGPYAGLVSGALAPVVSFALSSMPSASVLPLMIAEIAAYGFFGGILRNKKLPLFGKLVLVQLLGRGVRAAVTVLTALLATGSFSGLSGIYTSIVNGLPGIVLQWAVLPLLLSFLREKFKTQSE